MWGTRTVLAHFNSQGIACVFENVELAFDDFECRPAAKKAGGPLLWPLPPSDKLNGVTVAFGFVERLTAMRVRYKDLSLQQFRSFRDLCRLGSYAEVARGLKMSTSAVWEQIRGLERQIGVPLIDNQNGKIHPTPDGQKLLELVLPHINGLESASDVLDQLRGFLPETLTIVSGMRMLMEEIAEAVCDFRQRYPQVCIRLLYAEDHTIPGLIERREADLGLILEPGPDRVRRTPVIYEAAYELDYLLVTPPDHPLLSKSSLRLSDIVRYPLVMGESQVSSRRRIDEVFHRHNLLDRMQVAVETNSAALTFVSVRTGAGVGITAGHVEAYLSRGLGVRSLRKWFGAARYVFVQPRGSHVPPVQQALVDLIRQRVP
jgi:DNA-binding transcriptional LysR family regulator